MEINMDALTLEDCLKAYELKGTTFTICDGKVVEVIERD